MIAEVKSGLDYELLDIPGTSGLRIAVIPAMNNSETDSDTGQRLETEWSTFIVSSGATSFLGLGAQAIIGTASLLTSHLEVYGWYSETDRETGTNVSNQLFTSSRIRHSELFLVLNMGIQLAVLENRMASGVPISSVILLRLIKIGLQVPIPIQMNIFENCYVTSVQQVLDYLVVGFRISRKSVMCCSFNQSGIPVGIGACDINFISNSSLGT
jgi:hypothetical protein